MARRTKKKAAKKTKKKTRKKAKRKIAKRKTPAAGRKSAAKKQKKRAPRRSEAEMSWAEVRQSRRKKSDGRFRRIEGEFYRKVNMTPPALDRWLKTEKSHAAATPHSAADAAGHWSGRRTVEIMRKKKSGDYTPEDYAHMRKVIGFVGRHRARRPTGDLKNSPWRYALMNWGHDPLK
jgi:hypothetical protein